MAGGDACTTSSRDLALRRAGRSSRKGKSMASRFTVFPGMKGGKLSKPVLQRVWMFVALLTVFRPSVAFQFPPLPELHALTDFSHTNAKRSPLRDWNTSWNKEGKWIGDNPCGNFTGVKCWSTGNLRKLTLSQHALEGPISPALRNLTSLNTLYLNENNLTGAIGPVLAKLTWMKSLKLDGNNFTDSFKSNWVQSMRGLEELTLARNSFVGNISTGVFANLNNLTTVDMSNNSLSGHIPQDLVSLPSLQNLSLGGNKFNGHLPPVWNSTNLTFVDLSGNNLTGPIPPQLLNLRSITQLNLATNKFTGNVSAVQSSKFGCDAFADNPGLSMDDPQCSISLPAGATPPTLPPAPLSDSPTSTLPAVGAAVRPSPKNNSLTTLTIAALTVGNVVLILISMVGFVMLFMWWRRSKDSSINEGGDDTKQRTSWPIASKDMNSSISPNGGMDTGRAAKSSFAAKPDVKPNLKSVVGTIRDPSKDSMTTDGSLGQSFDSNNDFGTNVVILDTTLSLEFEDLLSAKASVLGAGSFGVVYTACLEDGHMLAIKRIEELALADQRAFGKRCAQLAVEALHPNLLQLRAYCWSPQEKLLIFDYVKNGSVHSLLHEGKWSSSNQGKAIDWETRLKIAVGTARALAHLHDSDMVHGNIKASNVLLDEQLEPRVSDFGLEALLQTPLQQQTGANDGYLAPELATGAIRRRTQDGDVYSLGMLLLELLTGKEPKGNNNGGLLAWVQEMTTANRTVELFDPALVSMHVLPTQDILEFLELAQACVSQDAAARPSITIVLRRLESIVPGSTAPRSYMKDDSIDSEASYYETTDNPFSPDFVITMKDDDDPDDHGSFFETTHNPFSSGFIKPVRVHMMPEQKSRDESGRMESPVSSVGSFYSNVSTPTSISPSAGAAVGVSPFRLSPLR